MSGTSSVPSSDGLRPAQNQLFLSYFISWHARFREVGTAETLISVAAGFGAGALCLSAPVWTMLPPGLQRGASLASAIAAGATVFVAAWRTQASKRARQSATDTLASALLDTNRECMKLLDVNGRMLRVSEYGAQLMDASSPLDLAGADWLGFWKGADSVTAKTAFNDALAGRYASFRALCHTTTGRPKWWDSRLTPLKDHDGKVVAVVCASTDITDQTELLTQLQAKNALMSEMEAHMPIVFYSYSANFDYFHYITAGCLKVFGLEPAVFEQDPAVALGQLDRAHYVRTRQRLVDGELVVIARDGARTGGRGLQRLDDDRTVAESTPMHQGARALVDALLDVEIEFSHGGGRRSAG